MILKNVSALLGEHLEYYPCVDIHIRNNGTFGKMYNSKDVQNNNTQEIVNCEGLLVIPGFVNAHTHIGDSIGKDVAIGHTVDDTIHPITGLKPQILKKTPVDILAGNIQGTCTSMIHKGITTFVDFREGGINGIKILKKVVDKMPIRAVILGRVNHYQDTSQIQKNKGLPPNRQAELKEVLENCDGIGISGANENSTSSLEQYGKTSKIRAIHAAETTQSIAKSIMVTGHPEVTRALHMNPHFLVHMTHASAKELKTITKKTRGVVVCPRANATLVEGVPNIPQMLETGCVIALGTDNVMINSPDMFKEMDYTWKISMGVYKKRVNPKEILMMATCNAAKLLNMKIGIIQEDWLADCIFFEKHSLDIEPMHNPYAAIVHRASESAIRATMINGKIVHGAL